MRDFVYISDRAYTRDQILNMEKIMLNALRFNLTVPSASRARGGSGARARSAGAARCPDLAWPCRHLLHVRRSCTHSPACPPLLLPGVYNFLGRNFKAAGAAEDKEVTLLASYLVELSLVDYTSLRYPYSMIAAAAVYVSQLAVGAPDPFCHALARHSGYTVAGIQDCAQHLAALMRKAPVSHRRRGCRGLARPHRPLGAGHVGSAPSHVHPPPRPPPPQNSSLVAVHKKYSSEKMQRIATTFDAPAALLQQ